MSTDSENLKMRISRLLSWEKRKRLEALLIMALCYGLVGALCAQPFTASLGGWSWAAAPVLFALLAPGFFFTRRWRDRDTARALAALDRTLSLDERATTAWELLRRNDARPVAQLVLRQAGEKLQSLDPPALFPRLWNWHGYLVAPLLALWLAMLWFDAGVQPDGARTGQPSLSQRLREFARQLQEKAQSESLPKTLKAGRELEKVAQRGIDAKTADEQLKTELAAMAKKMAAAGDSGGQAPFGAAESRQQLEDLRAELEAARDSFNAAEGAGQSWQDRLAGLSQLKKHMPGQKPGPPGPSRAEMQSFLDKLEQQVAGELDRRTLLEAEQFLQQLAQRGQGPPADAQTRAGGKDEKTEPGDGQREKNTGTAPGQEPGKNLAKSPSLPEFHGGARAQVKGMIGEGERSGAFFKAKPAPGKSKLSQDEVIASYRRQAEAELGTEKIPEELKDTIKNYFLSLEKAK